MIDRNHMYLALFVTTIAALCTVLAGAAPTVGIHTDADEYSFGETVQVSLSASNPESAVSVDAYVGLLAPDGIIYTLGEFGWSQGIQPWIQGVRLPRGFSVDRLPLCRLELPCESPPIDEPGEYDFAAVLTWAGTLDWVCDGSFAAFSYGTEPSADIRMARIPAGSFLMGSPISEGGWWSNELPQRTVHISAFAIAETEVTQRQWVTVMGWNESMFSGDSHPVTCVTWFDCVSFCNRLSEMEGRTECYSIIDPVYEGNHVVDAEVWCDFDVNGYRLPTEAEWEYACRAGTCTPFYWGNSREESIMKLYCWYDKNASSDSWTDPHAEKDGTQPVGQKLPNGFGLYDMSGNAYEWCWDWFDYHYYGTRPDPDFDPTGPSSGDARVTRGGAWYMPDGGSRSAFRFALVPSFVGAPTFVRLRGHRTEAGRGTQGVSCHTRAEQLVLFCAPWLRRERVRALSTRAQYVAGCGPRLRRTRYAACTYTGTTEFASNVASCEWNFNK